MIFKDLLSRTQNHRPLNWFKTLQTYYNRPEWELYDLKFDPTEVNNLATNSTYKILFEELQEKLYNWQNVTKDPWLCAPHGVLENKGNFKNASKCLPLDNLNQHLE